MFKLKKVVSLLGIVMLTTVSSLALAVNSILETTITYTNNLSEPLSFKFPLPNGNYDIQTVNPGQSKVIVYNSGVLGANYSQFMKFVMYVEKSDESIKCTKKLEFKVTTDANGKLTGITLPSETNLIDPVPANLICDFADLPAFDSSFTGGTYHLSVGFQVS